MKSLPGNDQLNGTVSLGSAPLAPSNIVSATLLRHPVDLEGIGSKRLEPVLTDDDRQRLARHGPCPAPRCASLSRLPNSAAPSGCAKRTTPSGAQISILLSVPLPVAGVS